MSVTTPTATPQSTLSDRFILAQVTPLTLVIPAVWVAEVFRAERSQILPLPFYGPLLAGIIHQGGRVLPLVSAHQLLNAQSNLLGENLLVIKLGDAAGTLAQVGLIVDRTLSTQTRAHLPASVFATPFQANHHQTMILLRPELVSPEVWQPYGWSPDTNSSATM